MLPEHKPTSEIVCQIINTYMFLFVHQKMPLNTGKLPLDKIKTNKHKINLFLLLGSLFHLYIF